MNISAVISAAFTEAVKTNERRCPMPYFTDSFGNPASKNHTFGNDAFKAVEESREMLAKAIKAKPQEIVFTSGATESINLAIKGAALANRQRARNFITVATEYKAVLDCFEWLRDVSFLG